jgi:hypothetical protein
MKLSELTEEKAISMLRQINSLSTILLKAYEKGKKPKLTKRQQEAIDRKAHYTKGQAA